MARKYLDENGLLYVWQKIKQYVGSIVPTKQSDLINDDYTVKDSEYGQYKTKIDDLEDRMDDIVTTGGEPNVIESVKVNGATLPVTNKAVNIIAETGTTDGSIAINGADVSVAGLGSAAFTNSTAYDRAGAAATILGGIGDAPTTPTVYGALAAAEAAQDGVDAINAAGYQTAADVNRRINEALDGITGISYEVVQSLPANGETGVIYLLANNGAAPNIYDEYIWTGSGYEKIGTTDVDLSGYMLTTDMVAITNAEIDTITSTPQSGS